MKKVLASILVGVIFQSCGILKNKNFTKITADHQVHYCGGEPPTEEMMEAMSTPSMAKEVSYYIHRNSDRSDSEIELKFDAKGVALVPKLEPGTYYLFKTTKQGLKGMENELTPDEMCLFNTKMMRLHKFEVTKKTKKIHLVFQVPCSPCPDPRP